LKNSARIQEQFAEKALVLVAAIILSIQGAIAMETIRVQSFKSGVIKVDGQPVTLSGLAEALAQIKAKHGAVLYYREDPAAEPSENQIEVFNALMSAQLPISMSSKLDFSDSIGPDGIPRPRR
jgi:hypothetical protein